MRKYASLRDTNMILMTTKNTQLLSFGSWNMRYPTSKFYYFGLLKNFTLIKAPFFLINRFCPSVFFVVTMMLI